MSNKHAFIDAKYSFGSKSPQICKQLYVKKQNTTIFIYIINNNKQKTYLLWFNLVKQQTKKNIFLFRFEYKTKKIIIIMSREIYKYKVFKRL